MAANAAANRHDFLVALDRALKQRADRRARRRRRSRWTTTLAGCASYSRETGEAHPARAARRAPRAAGVARGDGRTFAVVSGRIDAANAYAFSNGGELVLAPTWTIASRRAGAALLRPAARALEERRQAYGVPWNVLAAINKIESNFGRNMGPSSAGAIGWMQFMPSTWLRWGTDADGNGIADPWNPVDAIYSAARYLAASAPRAIPPGRLLLQPCEWYVDDVLQLAQLYGGSGAGSRSGAARPAAAVFALDRSRHSSRRRRRGRRRRARVRGARRRRRRSPSASRRLARPIAPLLSDRLDAQKRAAQVGVDADAAQASGPTESRARRRPGDAGASFRSKAQAASFNQPPGSSSPAAPAQAAAATSSRSAAGPVVSVSHTHHDYPAADIAAPEGSPLYALTDGRVLYAWSRDARCGIGFTIQATTARPGPTATSRTSTRPCSRAPS